MNNVLAQALEALLGLQRAGRKQGFNDGYESEMNLAESAIAALKEAIKQQGEPVGVFGGKRYTPENTTEFWGNLYLDDVTAGDLLYTSAPSIPEGWIEFRPAPIPEGWQLVPKEPTVEMIRFAGKCVPKSPAAQYRAMLSAAPEHKGEQP